VPNYRRAFRPGGTFFFTLVTAARAPVFSKPMARTLLHDAIEAVRKDRPFEIDAIVLLPDHLHALWTLPAGDADFSTRWASMKARFTRAWLASGGTEQAISDGRARKGGRGVWQERFWEHVIRDADDLNRHLDYIHYNPVKHGLAACPHQWAWSSFGRWVANGGYIADWQCCCGSRRVAPLDFAWAGGLEME
jgi:putative transposase